MGAQENKQSTQDAYAAFSSGDAEGAMRDIDDSIEWTVRGDNALTGTYKGKQAVGELWGKFTSKDFRTEPHDFIAEGDKGAMDASSSPRGAPSSRRQCGASSHEDAGCEEPQKRCGLQSNMRTVGLPRQFVLTNSSWVGAQ